MKSIFVTDNTSFNKETIGKKGKKTYLATYSHAHSTIRWETVLISIAHRISADRYNFFGNSPEQSKRYRHVSFALLDLMWPISR